MAKNDDGDHHLEALCFIPSKTLYAYTNSMRTSCVVSNMVNLSVCVDDKTSIGLIKMFFALDLGPFQCSNTEQKRTNPRK